MTPRRPLSESEAIQTLTCLVLIFIACGFILGWVAGRLMG